MADSSNLAKTLVIKAEDARILGDTKAMRAAYSQVAPPNPGLHSTHGRHACCVSTRVRLATAAHIPHYAAGGMRGHVPCDAV